MSALQSKANELIVAEINGAAQRGETQYLNCDDDITELTL